MHMVKNKAHNFENLIIIIVFLLCLFLPSFDSLFALDPVALSENRNLQKFPSLAAEWSDVRAKPFDALAWRQLAHSVYQYPRAFGVFFNDHFGFRRSLIRIHSHLMLN